MCPITSRVEGYPFEVEVPEGLKVTGAILCDQIKSLDWRGPARHEPGIRFGCRHAGSDGTNTGTGGPGHIRQLGTIRGERPFRARPRTQPQRRCFPGKPAQFRHSPVGFEMENRDRSR